MIELKKEILELPLLVKELSANNNEVICRTDVIKKICEEIHAILIDIKTKINQEKNIENYIFVLQNNASLDFPNCILDLIKELKKTKELIS